MVSAPQELCKQPFEKRKYTMEFGNNLTLNSETITGIYSISSVNIASDSASDLYIHSSGIQDGYGTSSNVYMWIESGTHQQKYRVEVQVLTNYGQRLEGDGYLTVKDK